MRVIVIGAGLAGLSTAYYLQRDGAEVMVIDRAAGPGRATSFANGAILHASLAEPWNAPGISWQILRWMGREDAPMLLRPRALPGLIGWGVRFLRNSAPQKFRANAQKNLRLALYSLRLMRELRAQTALNYAYQGRGLLSVFRSDIARSRRLAELEAEGAGGPAYRPLDRDELIEVEPALGPIAAQLVGGVHYTDDEGGDAHLFCRELARVLADGGAALHYETVVDGMEIDGRRIRGVRAAQQFFRGDAYVLAAGSDSPLLARGLRLPLPVRPVKGYSVTMPRERGPADAPRVGIEDSHFHAVVVPVGEDRVRVAGTAEIAGYDLSVHPRRIENLKRLLSLLFPRYAERLQPQDFTPWAGLRPMSADGVPLLGETPIENLFLNTGHGHLGWTLAAGSARLVADRILGRPAGLNPGDYVLARFR